MYIFVIYTTQTKQNKTRKKKKNYFLCKNLKKHCINSVFIFFLQNLYTNTYIQTIKMNVNTILDFDKAILNDVYLQMFGEKEESYNSQTSPLSHNQVKTVNLGNDSNSFTQSITENQNDWITLSTSQCLPTPMMPKSSSCLTEGITPRHDQENNQYQFILPYASNSDNKHTEINALAQSNQGKRLLSQDQSDNEKECINIGEQNITISDVSVRSMSESIIVSNTNEYYYSDESEEMNNIHVIDNQKATDTVIQSPPTYRRNQYSTTFQEKNIKLGKKPKKMSQQSSKRKSVPSKSSSSKQKSLLKNIPRIRKDGLVPKDIWSPRKKFISQYQTLKDTLDEVIKAEQTYTSLGIHQGMSPAPNIKSLLTRLGTEAVRMAHAHTKKSSAEMYPIFFVWAKKAPPSKDSSST